MNLPLILASQSPARLALLKQVNIIPTKIISANLDESELPQEKARDLAKRLAYKKAKKIAEQIDQGIIIAADTVPVVGRLIMRKANNKQDVKASLELISGRRHRVYTGVCVIYKAANTSKVARKVVQSILKFKRLTQQEINYYCELGEGVGKAGGYTIAGYAESYVEFIAGSFSNVIGLPLTETIKMLNGVGYSLPGKILE